MKWSDTNMNATDAVREIMKSKDIGVVLLANRLNIKQNVLSERLSQQNISIKKLDEMLRVLDYKIVLSPIKTKLPKDSYVVTTTHQ